MATFEAALVSLIEGGSSLKCYPVQKPQTVSAPVVVYKRISTIPQRILNSKSTFNQARTALTVWGKTFDAMKSAVATVNGLLDVNMTNFTLAYIVDQREYKDPDTGLFYTYLEYIFLAHMD